MTALGGGPATEQLDRDALEDRLPDIGEAPDEPLLPHLHILEAS